MELSNEWNRVVLCLGSNLDKEPNMERAAEHLRARFSSIRFAPSVYTKSIDCPIATTFLNQVAVFYSPDAVDVIKKVLKEIERSLGRKPDDKGLGRIPIDIDLLCWNEHVFKADDLRRDYIVAGIRSLLPEGGSHERWWMDME